MFRVTTTFFHSPGCGRLAALFFPSHPLFFWCFTLPVTRKGVFPKPPVTHFDVFLTHCLICYHACLFLTIPFTLRQKIFLFGNEKAKNPPPEPGEGAKQRREDMGEKYRRKAGASCASLQTGVACRPQTISNKSLSSTCISSRPLSPSATTSSILKPRRPGR